VLEEPVDHERGELVEAGGKLVEHPSRAAQPGGEFLGGEVREAFGLEQRFEFPEYRQGACGRWTAGVGAGLEPRRAGGARAR